MELYHLYLDPERLAFSNSILASNLSFRRFDVRHRLAKKTKSQRLITIKRLKMIPIPAGINNNP